jgi:hypothetical protein
LRQLSALQARGLPPFLVEPLRVLLTGRCPASARAIVDRIERRRDAVANSGRRYRFVHRESPHGFVRWLVDVSSEASIDARGDGDDIVTSRWLARSVSLNKRWALFLHLCATHGSARMDRGFRDARRLGGRPCRPLRAPGLGRPRYQTDELGHLSLYRPLADWPGTPPPRSTLPASAELRQQLYC